MIVINENDVHLGDESLVLDSELREWEGLSPLPAAVTEYHSLDKLNKRSVLAHCSGG